MINRDVFSQRLRELKEKSRLTTTEIAKTLGIRKQSVHTWENGKTVPNADNLVELADLFEVSLDYLVGRAD